MQNTVIIVAGGLGLRMGKEIPKQFLLLQNRPVIFHTIQHFLDFDQAINLIIVLPENHINTWKTMCNEYSFHVEHIVVAGGETRYHSVKNGLEKVHASGLVAVHDSVRPNINKEFISRCFNEAENNGNAIPCISINESLRKVSNTESSPVDRSKIKIIQTPQVFSSDMLKKAYTFPYRESFTDDASVVEFSGAKINLVEGLRENIKITQPSDLLYSELLLENQKTD